MIVLMFAMKVFYIHELDDSLDSHYQVPITINFLNQINQLQVGDLWSKSKSICI